MRAQSQESFLKIKSIMQNSSGNNFFVIPAFSFLYSKKDLLYFYNKSFRQFNFAKRQVSVGNQGKKAESYIGTSSIFCPKINDLRRSLLVKFIRSSCEKLLTHHPIHLIFPIVFPFFQLHVRLNLHMLQVPFEHLLQQMLNRFLAFFH